MFQPSIVVSTSPTPNRRVDPAPILLTGTLDDIISQAHQAGADGVELRLTDEDLPGAVEIHERLVDAGLVVGGISSGRIAREQGLCLTAMAARDRARAAEALCRLVDVANVLETDLLVGSAKGSQCQDEPLEAYCDRLGESLSIVSEYSKSGRVKIHLEAINRFEINCLTTARETLDFLKAYDLENFYVHLDSFHMNIEETDPAEAIRSVGDRLGYIQFADSNRRAPGDGHIDFGAYRDALAESPFTNLLSIECQPIPDGLTAARRGIDYIRNIFGITS